MASKSDNLRRCIQNMPKNKTLKEIIQQICNFSNFWHSYLLDKKEMLRTKIFMAV
jgi:hypothetical protein